MAVARRPLTVDELSMAYALELGGWTANKMPPSSYLDDFNDVFKVCEPIVFLDITSQTINLVHQSAKDYLVGQHLKLKQRSCHNITFI